MKEVCDLDESKPNYAWCFDCVPEENSLLLKYEDVIVEIPSQDLVLTNLVSYLEKAYMHDSAQSSQSALIS